MTDDRDSRPPYLPLVHGNGTPRAMLIEQMQQAITALDEAIVALAGMAPNHRDYYPLPPAHWSAALGTFHRRHAALVGLRQEIERDARLLVDEG